jgi:uncharacterized protein YgiB involved in biofilm formation
MTQLRRSQYIVLALIGTTAALRAYVPSAQRAVHDRYASLEDCSADWGRPDFCTQDQDNRPLPGNFGGPRMVYRGPTYAEGDREAARYEARSRALRLGSLNMAAASTGSHAIEQSVPSRGGFGSSAHVFGRMG